MSTSLRHCAELTYRTPCFKVKVIAGGQRAPVEKVCPVNNSMSDSQNISPLIPCFMNSVIAGGQRLHVHTIASDSLV